VTLLVPPRLEFLQNANERLVNGTQQCGSAVILDEVVRGAPGRSVSMRATNFYEAMSITDFGWSGHAKWMV
jgi:glutamate-1-semialdehyde aminotransferase